MNSFYSEEELQTWALADAEQCPPQSQGLDLRPEKIEIGNNVRIDDFCILSGTIKIGNYVHISAFVGLFGTEGITIGDYVAVSSKVSVFTVNDDYTGESMTNPMVPERYRRPTTGPVAIGTHAIIGAGQCDHAGNYYWKLGPPWGRCHWSSPIANHGRYTPVFRRVSARPSERYDREVPSQS